jgi:ATP-dependent DNA helicase RecQ
VVFHDAALLDMIRLRPCVLHEMLEVSGVGQSKLQKYGQAFLDVLNRFDRSEPEASSE